MGAAAGSRLTKGLDGALTALARGRPRGPIDAILIGLLAAVPVLMLRGGLNFFYGGLTGFMILLPGVVLAALAGGMTAGLVALAACLIGGWLLVGSSGPASIHGLVQIATFNFLIVGLFAATVAASLRRTLRRLHASLQDLQAAGARIHEAEDRLNLLSEQAPVMLWMSDESGHCVHLNAAQRAFWQAPVDLTGFDFAQTVHPEDRERLVAETAAAAAERRPLVLDARFRRHDGSWRRLHSEARPRFDRDGRFLGMIGVNIDVTDAFVAESALRESEARFRTLADSAPAPVFLVDADGALVLVNKALEDFYGRPEHEMIGHIWRKALHPDDIVIPPHVLENRPPGPTPFSFEARFRRHDGAWRWLTVSIRPRLDLNGELAGYVGMAFDVTDSRDALAALARQERRQRFLLELSDRLRHLTDAETIMIEVERSVGDLLEVGRVGYGEIDQERGEIVMSRDWTSGVVSAEGRFDLHELGAGLIQELASGATVRVTDVLTDPRTEDARAALARLQTRALVRTPLIRGGRMRAFLYVHHTEPRDWTDAEVALLEEVADRTWSEIERTRAEAELRESEERFRAIADTAPVLIWVTGQGRRRAFVNQAYVAFVGGDYDAALAQDWRDVLHPDDQDRIIAESVAGEAKGRPFAMEARYRRNDGAWRWLKSFSRPRFGVGGAVVGFVGVAFDVTEAKLHENDLKRINELLEERVAEALAEKARAEADLVHSQRLEAVGRLTGGVAHDFNNLLTVVIGALDLILKNPSDPAKRDRLGQAALAAARRGERLTHQLLAFSRRQTLRPEAVDLNRLISESEPLLRRAVGEAVVFEIALRPGGAQVMVDPGQFEAALLNLIVNAGDAVGDHGRIRLKTALKTLKAGEIRELEAGRYVCVSVSDDGAGIAADIVDRIFDPFFTTKPVGKGTGLGLSQVYGFVRQSGGGVHVVSRPGKGTDFRLYLPWTRTAETRGPDAASSSEDAALAGRRLLLVEDDPAVAAIAVDLLTDLGLAVTPVETGPAAVDALRNGRYDVMLSDVVMPGGMSGVELARHCASEHPQVRIILASGYAGEKLDEFMGAAPWPFVRKPYSADDLRAALGVVETA